MKIVNLIIHILSAGLLFSWSIVPMLMNFMGELVAYAFGGTGYIEGLVPFLTGIVSAVLAFIVLVLGIVSFALRNKGSVKRYTIFESLITGFSLLTFVIQLPVTMYMDSAGLMGGGHEANVVTNIDQLIQAMYIPAVLGLILSVISVILIIVTAATSKRRHAVS